MQPCSTASSNRPDQPQPGITPTRGKAPRRLTEGSRHDPFPQPGTTPQKVDRESISCEPIMRNN